MKKLTDRDAHFKARQQREARAESRVTDKEVLDWLQANMHIIILGAPQLSRFAWKKKSGAQLNTIRQAVTERLRPQKSGNQA